MAARGLVLSRSRSICVVASLIVSLGSLILAAFYVEGDQKHYINVYEQLAYLPFSEAYRYYSSALSSGEVVHFLLSWLFSRLVEKEVFVALSNGAFAYLALRYMSRHGVSLWISVAFVLTNFYMYVCYFAAERLKFGLIFALLALILRERVLIAIMAALVSALAHVQMLLFGAAFGAGALTRIDWGRALRSPGRIVAALLFLIPLVVLAVEPIANQIAAKLDTYSASVSAVDFVKGLIFFLMALVYGKPKTQVCMVYAPILAAIGVVGGERVVIFAYFAFLFYALQVRGGRNIAVIGSLGYFAGKAFLFTLNIVSHGDGFY